MGDLLLSDVQPPPESKNFGLLLKICYPLLGLVMILAAIYQTQNADYLGDFWEHAAVIRELAAHLVAPRHPQLEVNAPHEFYSPYAIYLALVSRLFHWSPVLTLWVMGCVNLVLFLLSVLVFLRALRELTPAEEKWSHLTAAFYFVLFSLFLWGHLPWPFPGFLHASGIGETLSYPSFFSIFMTLFIFSFYLNALKDQRIWKYAVLWLLITVILVSHPMTVPFLLSGLIALSLQFQRDRKALVLLSVCIVAAFVAAAFWPYFPFYDLITSGATGIHESNRRLYNRVLVSTYPALLGIFALWERFRRNRLDFIVTIFFITVLLYAFGFVTRNWSFGRIIAHSVLLLHLALAIWAAKLESAVLSRTSVTPREKIFAGLTAAVLIVTVLDTPRHLLRHYHKNTTYNHIYLKYRFVGYFARQYETVMAELKPSWYIPAFNGKVIASKNPLAFVPDHAERIADLERFFGSTGTDNVRQKVVEKYRPAYVLIDESTNTNAEVIRRFLRASGATEYKYATVSLFRLVPLTREVESEK